MMPAAFAPFVKDTPLCVMTRLALERLVEPKRLDQLFGKTAQRQYEKELLFSEVVELMMSVVLRVEDNVNSAYKKRQAKLGVSDQAVYDKLKATELGLSVALVTDSAVQIGPVIDALGARLPAWLRGHRVRVIDGNLLGHSERRIKELRQTWCVGLPGRSLAVYDQELDLVTNVFLTPDGHASERSLFDAVLETVQANELWIADRNFCTFKFLFGIAARQAKFVIRHHATLTVAWFGQRQYRGRNQTGRVYEQDVKLEWEGRKQRCRRVTIVLDKPTRDGETEIHILTNLSRKHARAKRVAELYRKRWTIEGRFYEITQTLQCEPNTLGYPKAALFAFCLALVASNAMALIRASLRAVHGEDAVAEMSRHYMAVEIRGTYRGMMVALPPRRWLKFRHVTTKAFAKLLREISKHVRLEYYRKARRGPKKPPVRKNAYKKGGHVSTQKLLEQRRSSPE